MLAAVITSAVNVFANQETDGALSAVAALQPPPPPPAERGLIASNEPEEMSFSEANDEAGANVETNEEQEEMSSSEANDEAYAIVERDGGYFMMRQDVSMISIATPWGDFGGWF